MAQLLVIAHAPLASAMRQVAEHTFPDCAPTLAVLDVDQGMCAEDVEAAEGRVGLLHERPAGGRVGHVGPDGHGPGGGARLRVILRQATQDFHYPLGALGALPVMDGDPRPR